ncbi:transglutaminase [bacterium]|nr:MAG: transglutaminase [bacterium]
MRFKSLIIGLLLAWGAAPCIAAPGHGDFMKTGAKTAQPVGHYRFCETHAAECRPTEPHRNATLLTEVAWNVIKQVNTTVNRRIIQVTDEEYYRKVEFWTYPKSAGDCEDFALLKKRELKARGFADADLLITVVKKRDGSGHAILTVHTSEGDFVLDNLDDRVKRWWDTPYRFEKRQSADDAGKWVVIEQPTGSVPVAAIN